MPKSVFNVKVPDGYTLLYHGTAANPIFKTPDLSKCKDGGDFGRGFYLTRNYSMAKSWANIQYNRCGLRPHIIAFALPDITPKGIYRRVFTNSHKDLDDWLNFIMNCRRIDSRRDNSKHDIVIGPTADDRTYAILQEYSKYLSTDGLYGLSKEETIKSLQITKLAYQYCLRSEEAINLLKYIDWE